LKSKYKIGYDHQSMQSVAGKLSCKRTALKRCIKIEILWYRKLVSRVRASSVHDHFGTYHFGTMLRRYIKSL